MMTDCKICQNARQQLKQDGIPDSYLADTAWWERFHRSKLHEQYRLDAMSGEDKIKYGMNRLHSTQYILEEEIK